MRITENINLAFGAIKSNLLRSILTILIIAIGIGALVGTLTAIDAIKSTLTTTFSSMGSNSFEIRQWRTRRSDKNKKIVKAVRFDEATQFKKRFDYPATVTVSTRATSFATLKYKDEKSNPNINTTGVDENYLQVAGYEIAAGRNFTDKEITEGRQMVLIGQGVVEKLFDKSIDAALDKSILVENTKCKIIGILASKGSSGAFNADNVAFLPVQLVRKKYINSNRTYSVNVQVEDAENLAAASEEATGLMRAIRKVGFGKDDDFEIAKSDKLASTFIENLSFITMAATLIGLITLIGAGVGLMNIMLVSVSERTREIGISKAIGASSAMVRRQFLIESILISMLGGAVGILLGIIFGNGVSKVTGGPFIIPWLWILFGLMFCIFVGLLAGLYPALKAARLDPIESLRYE